MESTSKRIAELTKELELLKAQQKREEEEKRAKASAEKKKALNELKAKVTEYNKSYGTDYVLCDRVATEFISSIRPFGFMF